jgi:phage terminase large subunit-like protein
MRRAWSRLHIERLQHCLEDMKVGVPQKHDSQFAGGHRLSNEHSLSPAHRIGLDPAELENKIKATARWDGEETRIRIGQAGKFQAAYLVGQLRGYLVSSEREEGDKERRADPFAA